MEIKERMKIKGKYQENKLGGTKKTSKRNQRPITSKTKDQGREKEGKLTRNLGGDSQQVTRGSLVASKCQEFALIVAEQEPSSNEEDR